MKNIYFIVFMLVLVTHSSMPASKNKHDIMQSSIHTKNRVFINNDIFNKSLDITDWQNSAKQVFSYIEENSKLPVIGTKDKIIMQSLSVLISVNKTIISTIKNTYEEYLSKNIKTRMQEAKTYLLDNMIEARGALIREEKNSALLQLRSDKITLERKKDAITVILNMANTLKEIANKAIDDFRKVEKNIPSAQKNNNAVINSLKDVFATDLKEYTQEMNNTLKNVPVNQEDFKIWLQQANRLNEKIRVMDSNLAQSYNIQIARTKQNQATQQKRGGITIKPSLKDGVRPNTDIPDLNEI